VKLVLMNQPLLELWEILLNDSPDSETRARINGVASQMKTFDYFFGTCLLCLLFQHTDNLSKTLQHTKMSAIEGQVVAGVTVSTLQVSTVKYISMLQYNFHSGFNF